MIMRVKNNKESEKIIKKVKKKDVATYIITLHYLPDLSVDIFLLHPKLRTPSLLTTTLVVTSSLPSLGKDNKSRHASCLSQPSAAANSGARQRHTVTQLSLFALLVACWLCLRVLSYTILIPVFLPFSLSGSTGTSRIDWWDPAYRRVIYY